MPRLAAPARSSLTLCRASLVANRRVFPAATTVRCYARAPTLGPEADHDKTSISKIVKGPEGGVLKLFIGERAAQKINEIKKEDNDPTKILRVAIESGGCHGFQYILSLKSESDITDEDVVFERDGAKVAVDPTSLEILRESTVDYTTELIGSQFKVTGSPYTTSHCGCGSSFDFDPSKVPVEN